MRRTALSMTITSVPISLGLLDMITESKYREGEYKNDWLVVVDVKPQSAIVPKQVAAQRHGFSRPTRRVTYST